MVVPMELSAKIDQVKASLETLKMQAADAPVEANSQFSSILETALDGGNDTARVKDALPTKLQAQATPQIPAWVNTDYGYDPANPRKPNMRELMEALSGRSVEALYADAGSNWQETSRLASELLYGVVGSNDDIRNWDAIMGSSDIVKAARQATGEMHAPVVNILSIRDGAGVVTEQIATINDANGNVLRSLPSSIEQAREILENFGVTSASIPEDLSTRIVVDNFNYTILDLLVNFKSRYEGNAIAMVADSDSASSTADFLGDRALA
jgi:hypothetical protein